MKIRMWSVRLFISNNLILILLIKNRFPRIIIKISAIVFHFFIICLSVWFGCLGFMAYQPLCDIYCQIHLHTNNHLCFKQLRFYEYSLIVKNISISSYSVSSNSSNSTKSFKYKYRFCLQTVKCQNSSILNNSA